MKEKTCKDRTIIKPLGGGHIEKKAFLPSSDEKTWFLTCPVVFKWSKMAG